MTFPDKKVLIVEDNEMNRMLAGFALNEYEIVPDEAADGKEAVDLFLSKGEGYYDLILMDVMMPVMDGIEATTAIRNSGRSDSNSIPIVAMTAESDPEVLSKLSEQGFSDCIEKPIDDEMFAMYMVKYLA